MDGVAKSRHGHRAVVRSAAVGAQAARTDACEHHRIRFARCRAHLSLQRPVARFCATDRAVRRHVMTALMISNIVLWIVVLSLLVVVLALTRQLGVLHERITPVGALML